MEELRKMKVLYQTDDGTIFADKEAALDYETKQAYGDEVNEDALKWLRSNAGENLLKKHSLDDVGLWKVEGEDRNCDLAGPRDIPHLFNARGRLRDVVNKAVNTKGFYGWGAGGRITKMSVEVLDMDTGKNERIE